MRESSSKLRKPEMSLSARAHSHVFFHTCTLTGILAHAHSQAFLRTRVVIGIIVHAYSYTHSCACFLGTKIAWKMPRMMEMPGPHTNMVTISVSHAQ